MTLPSYLPGSAPTLDLLQRVLPEGGSDMSGLKGEDLWDESLIDIVRFNPAAPDFSLARIPSGLDNDWPLRRGFAVPVDHETRRPVEGIFDYLLHLHDRGVCRSETNRAYAYALKPFAEVLKIEGRPYRYADDEILGTVVSSLMQGAGRYGQPLSGSTIEACVRTVARCVDYTNLVGSTDILLDADAHVARGWQVSSMVRSDGSRLDTSMLETARRHIIRPLSRRSIDTIEACLLMDPAKWHREGPSSRPGVTFSNGRRNGMRLIENQGLLVDEVMRPVVLDPNKEYLFPIFRTKGADYRNIFVLGHDIIRWQAYFNHERKACVAAARAIHGNSWDEPPQLLVNSLSSGLHVGHATQPSAMQRDFRKVQEGLGMVDVVMVPKEGGGERALPVMWHCYHDLRHTYAYAMYRAAKLRSDHFADDPVAFVQLRLGHKFASTTMRIYLWPDLRKLSAIGDHAVAGIRNLVGAGGLSDA